MMEALGRVQALGPEEREQGRVSQENQSPCDRGPSCISGEGEGSELRANRQTLWFSDLTQIGA